MLAGIWKMQPSLIKELKKNQKSVSRFHCYTKSTKYFRNTALLLLPNGPRCCAGPFRREPGRIHEKRLLPLDFPLQHRVAQLQGGRHQLLDHLLPVEFIQIRRT